MLYQKKKKNTKLVAGVICGFVHGENRRSPALLENPALTIVTMILFKFLKTLLKFVTGLMQHNLDTSRTKFYDSSFT